MPNTPPATPILAPQPDPVRLPNNDFLLPPTLDDASTTASGLSELSSLQTSPNSSPATSPRNTYQQTDQGPINKGRQQ